MKKLMMSMVALMMAMSMNAQKYLNESTTPFTQGKTYVGASLSGADLSYSGITKGHIGLQAKAEIFADRAYMDDLSLVPRKEEGSMITDESIAIDRCVRMVKEGKVTARSGKELDISGDTLCVHGDGPKALAFVQKIRDYYEQSFKNHKDFSTVGLRIGIGVYLFKDTYKNIVK